jgi:NADH-quinone oxidoreductase subunit J
VAGFWQEGLFFVFATVIALAAIGVVVSRNVIHAALYLVATLVGAACVYILMFAEFVAWAQVLVYVGAIVVLMLFGLMLTRAPIGKQAVYDNDQKWLAALVAAAIFGVTSWVLIDAFDGVRLPTDRVQATTSREVGEAIFTRYVLPFELVSVLLLAALVGAVVIARRDGRVTSRTIEAARRRKAQEEDV